LKNNSLLALNGFAQHGYLSAVVGCMLGGKVQRAQEPMVWKKVSVPELFLVYTPGSLGEMKWEKRICADESFPV